MPCAASPTSAIRGRDEAPGAARAERMPRGLAGDPEGAEHAVDLLIQRRGQRVDRTGEQMPREARALDPRDGR